MKTIKCHFLILLIFSHSCVSKNPEGKGWISLFNGKNLDG
jgi:hypothetical protein